MIHRWTAKVALSLLILAPNACAGDTHAQDPDGLLDFKALAVRIDYWLGVRQAAQGAKGAPIADDAEFIRRVYLDVAGCVPSVVDARDFIDDRRPDKRLIWVEMLLDGRKPSRKPDAFTSHFTNVWRAWLLSRVDTERAAALGSETEKWLQARLKDNLPYDRLVRQLVTEAPSGDNRLPVRRRRSRGCSWVSSWSAPSATMTAQAATGRNQNSGPSPLSSPVNETSVTTSGPSPSREKIR
jgi:Protein of unknown function (DUF1549)